MKLCTRQHEGDIVLNINNNIVKMLMKQKHEINKILYVSDSMIAWL